MLRHIYYMTMQQCRAEGAHCTAAAAAAAKAAHRVLGLVSQLSRHTSHASKTWLQLAMGGRQCEQATWRPVNQGPVRHTAQPNQPFLAVAAAHVLRAGQLGGVAHGVLRLAAGLVGLALQLVAGLRSNKLS
jgi:hypothetical protein